MDYQQNQESLFQNQSPLPNATAVLVLGIISIPACCFYGVGIIFGIIALVMANKDRTRYDASPESYTQSSYKNLNAGRVCAIIGTILSALCIVMLVFMIATIGWDALNNQELLKERLKMH